MNGHKVGEVAKLAGITVRTLHHYDRIGLLSPSARSEGGFRLYSAEDLSRLHAILALRSFGYSLSRVSELLRSGTVRRNEIITMQIEVLEGQAKRALMLKNRLVRLRESGAGEKAVAADLIDVLAMMRRYEKHFSLAEIEEMAARSGSAGRNLRQEWAGLSERVKEAWSSGVDPGSADAMGLVVELYRILGVVSGRNPDLTRRLGGMLRERDGARGRNGLPRKAYEWLCRASDIAKERGLGEVSANVER